jgi:diguanylate cyclase (GGDEF)-like protein
MVLVLNTLIGALAISVLLVLIFILLYVQNRESYLRDWLVAWSASLLALVCLFGMAISADALTAYMCLMSVCSYFLMRASHQFFGIKMPRYYIYSALLIVIWLIAGAVFGVPELIRGIPWSIFIGIVMIVYGLMFIRRGDRKIGGKTIAGVNYILWGIHALDFPYLQSVPPFVPWGFLLGTIFATGGAIGTLYYYFDMKNRRLLQTEEELKYISLHDSLTGLLNRGSFEQEIMRRERGKRTAKGNCPPVGIVICDVDGLKLVNDTLGHERGDALLIQAARTIQGVFQENCPVFRIGGDEFAAVLEDSEEGLARAYRDIHEALSLHNAGNPELPLSISVGYAVDNALPDLTRVFKEADNNMYREKRKQGQEARDSVVESLMAATAKKDCSQSHAGHLQDMIIDLSRAAGLTTVSEADLCLFARYHDIGKLGVSEEILFKPGPLEADEKEKIILHCEIGCRIAQSAAKLSPIADLILKHHEWWNGEGYPQGLKRRGNPRGMQNSFDC